MVDHSVFGNSKQCVRSFHHLFSVSETLLLSPVVHFLALWFRLFIWGRAWVLLAFLSDVDFGVLFNISFDARHKVIVPLFLFCPQQAFLLIFNHPVLVYNFLHFYIVKVSDEIDNIHRSDISISVEIVKFEGGYELVISIGHADMADNCHET